MLTLSRRERELNQGFCIHPLYLRERVGVRELNPSLCIHHLYLRDKVNAEGREGALG